MKTSNKKRIENLENILAAKIDRPKCARAIYDPNIPNFDTKSLGIDAEVILMMPDNGRRYPNQKDL